jgi:hypothetical protein
LTAESLNWKGREVTGQLILIDRSIPKTQNHTQSGRPTVVLDLVNVGDIDVKTLWRAVREEPECENNGKDTSRCLTNSPRPRSLTFPHSGS